VSINKKSLQFLWRIVRFSDSWLSTKLLMGFTRLISHCQWPSPSTRLQLALCNTNNLILLLSSYHHHPNLFQTNTSICFSKRYTWWPKKVSCKLLSISSPNIRRFSKIFHRHILWKICNKVDIKYIPPHLNCVVTLPCEI